MSRDMDLVCKLGLMELSMKESGRRTKPMVGANSGTLMVTYTKENGRKIKLMDSVFMYISTEPGMKVSGEMICKTEKAKKAGKMDLATQEATWKA